MRVGSLFTGIGGFDLGLERAGMEIRWQAETDPFCRRVLAKHWPQVPNLGDVTKINWDEVEKVDVICGGFPCQPVSLAGRQRAQADPRWLWPEFNRCLRALRPAWALLENVPGLLVHGMGDVLGDLARCGYDAEWQSVPAAAFGAPHIRYRVFIIAYPHSEKLRVEPICFRRGGRQTIARDDGETRVLADADSASRNGSRAASQTLQRPDEELRSGRRSGVLGNSDGERQPQPGGEISEIWGRSIDTSWWTVEPDVGRMAHGVSARVDRLRTLGNAIVPQAAEAIGRCILE